MDHPLLRRDSRIPERDARDAFKGSMSFIEMAKTPTINMGGGRGESGRREFPIV